MPAWCCFTTALIHCPSCIASLATRSMLHDNLLNKSSTHLSSLSRHLFKIEIWKDKLPTLCQPLLQLGCFLSTTQTSSQKKQQCFSIKTSLWSKNSWFSTVVINNIFWFLFFRKGLVQLRLQFLWTNTSFGLLFLSCPVRYFNRLAFERILLYSIKLYKPSRCTDIKSPSTLL